MKRQDRSLNENAQQYGITSSLEQLSDTQLFQLVLGGKQGENDKLFTKLQEIIEENNGILGIVSSVANIEALFSIDLPKALQIAALLETSKRLVTGIARKKMIIRNPREAAASAMLDMMFLDHEEMHVVLLDTRSHIIARIKAYRGTVNSTILRGAEIFRPAIVRNAPSIIICHNHPSGDPEPSPEDIDATKQIVEAGKLLDIAVLDHLVIGNNRYVSLRDRMDW